MNIPINLFMWGMALLPIIVLLILLIKCQWGATEAAPIGLMITIFTGVFLYKADIRLIEAESAKGIWNALIILLIVWTAILMYQVSDEAKAFLKESGIDQWQDGYPNHSIILEDILRDEAYVFATDIEDEEINYDELW